MNRQTPVQTACLFGLSLFVATVALTQTHGWARLAVGMGMYALLAGLIWVSGLGLSGLGLARSHLRSGVMLGLRVSALIAAGLLLTYLVAPEIFHDERYQQGFWLALAMALFLVPLQTVVFEELLFRGLLWGYVRRLKGPAMATQISSVAFGLWHIAPSLAINAAAISVGGVGINRGLLITGIVFVTYGAGVALCELRRRSDSLLAPILVHWAINGFSVVLAALAWSGR